MRLHISTFASVTLTLTLTLTLALQANAVPYGSLYWTDVYQSNIQSVGLDGSGRTTLLQDLRVPTNITVATGANKIYWAEQASSPSPRRIRRANFDGTEAESVLSPVMNVADIVIDEPHGLMYSSQTNDGGSGIIVKSTLDGASSTTVATFSAGAARGISLDTQAGKLYWVEPLNNCIRRSNLDGTQVETVLASGLDYPVDLRIDPVERKLYWTNVSTSGLAGSVARANMDGSGVETIFAVAPNRGSVSGLALDVDARKLYWGDRVGDRIWRADLDGSNAQTFLTGVTAVSGLQVIALPEPASLILMLIPMVLLRRQSSSGEARKA